MTSVIENEFVREYNAPIDQVWKALTVPEDLMQCWGAENTTIPECKVDLMVGGRFYIVMEADENMGSYRGTLWPMEAKFTVIEDNSKLYYEARAWTKGKESTTQIEQETEINLTEESGKTIMKVKATINKVGPDATMAAEGMKQGFNQSFDKLEKFLSR